MFFLLLGVLTDVQKSLVEKIFRDHYDRFRWISLRIVKAEHLADDAVAAALVKIMDNISRINEMPYTQMMAFCVTIVKNASIDIIRDLKKTQSTELIDTFDGGVGYSVEDQCQFNSDVQRLTQAIDRLPQEERFLVYMKYVQGLKYPEIAKILGISEETAKKRGQRILKKLKKKFEEGEPL